MFGAFDPARGLSRPAFLTFMSLAALGTLLTAAYLLLVVRRVCMGSTPQTTPEAHASPGARKTHESPKSREAHAAPEAPESPAPPQTPEAPRAPAPATATGIQDVQDLQGYELATWSPLVVLTVLAGLWPAALLGLTDPAVQKLLAGGKA